MHCIYVKALSYYMENQKANHSFLPVFFSELDAVVTHVACVALRKHPPFWVLTSKTSASSPDVKCLK